MMNYQNICINKDKIPKDLSYILKTSFLVQALQEAEITTHISLNFGLGHPFFESFYWLANQNVHYERFYIRTGVVKSYLCREAQERMHTKVIPEFIQWAKEIIMLPDRSTQLSHNLHFYKK